MNRRVDWQRAYTWPKGQRWNDATHIKQDGVVFKWDDIDIRYKLTTENTSHIEWRTSGGV